MTISLVWIPAYVGIRGNEMADAAAKRAIREGVDTQHDIFPVDFKVMWKDKLWEEWETWLAKASESKGVFYSNNLYGRGRKPWFAESNLRKIAGRLFPYAD